MDANEIHDILQKDFYTSNKSHNAYIPKINQQPTAQIRTYTDENTNEMKINQDKESTLDTTNTFDDDILNNLLDNPEEEIVFNYDEIDVDELEEQYEEGTNNELKQHNNEVINK